MARDDKKSLKQKLTRESAYTNRYGMNPGQIRKSLDKADAAPSKTREMPLRKKGSVRPKKAARNDGPERNPKLLLDVPAVSTQLAFQYPTPDWFTTKEKAEVSVIIPVYKSAAVLKDLIEQWDLGNDGVRLEIIFVDDNCPANSKDEVMRLWLGRKSEIKRPVGKIISCPENGGFASACNVGAYFATGDHLIFLNADTITGEGWVRPIVRLLKKDDVGIVGNLQMKHGGKWHDTIDSAGSEWLWNDKTFLHVGRHTYGRKHIAQPFRLDNCPADLLEPGEREMVTGCCIAMRKALFDEVGGFDLNYRIGYWEDADLCLRVREAGYKILYQPASKIYHKLSHTGSGGHRFMQHNINYFANRWLTSGRIDPLVKDKRAEERPEIRTILVRRQSARGDVLIAASVAAALKKKYPGAKVHFHTRLPDVVEGNPHIDRILRAEEVTERGFQLYFNLDMAYESRPHTNILKAYADVCGVDPDDCVPYLACEPVGSLPEDYVVIHAGKTNWVGRDWSPMKFDMVASRIRKLGQNVICVGGGGDHKVPCDLDLKGKTDLKQMAYVISKAKLFVGIDSFPFHVAQAFHVPAVTFFGSIKPELRIYRDNVRAVTADGLRCLGCHHKRPAPSTVTNVCKTETLDCVNLVGIETFMKKVEEALNG